MGRMYTVQFENIAVAAAQDFFYLAPADDKPLAIHAIFIDQFTELGDIAEEFLRYQLIRGHATVGSGGAAVTPAPLSPLDTAAGFTARRNDTTIASAGTAVILHSGAFNVRAGLALIFTPEMRPLVTQTQTTLVLRLLSTPADSITMSGTLYVEELV